MRTAARSWAAVLLLAAVVGTIRDTQNAEMLEMQQLLTELGG